MLGNFSFGDYFKREAINWAWEFLTKKEWLGLDPDRLYVSVYTDDDEAAGIWASDIKLSPERIKRMGEDDNFWPAGAPSRGPDGVCGPCSEIFYKTGGSGDVEIWNLVFTQFNRVGMPPNNLRPLPSRNIDTGMGLERTAAVLQNVESNFHIDILRPLVEAAGEVCGVKYDPKSENGRRLRRIADHVRACTFAIHENVYPGPNKEKYVIKRLLRRAVLDGRQMGVHEPFLHKLAPLVAEIMRTPYPELGETTTRVAQVIEKEESNFFSTIDAGLDRIERLFAQMKTEGRETVAGAEAAEMYTTHGFPPELFETMAAEHNLGFDWSGFNREMEQHGIESGAGHRVELFKTGPLDALKKTLGGTSFVGYETTTAEAQVVGIIARGELVEQIDEVGHGEPICVVLDKTPFYGESGGQVGDTGEIAGRDFRFDVTDTQRDGNFVLHLGHLRTGHLEQGAAVTARVEATRRQGIRRAHSATHLLHYALQKHLGKHAQQQGSKVDRDWLRFDFSNPAAVTPEELEQIESEVNALVSGAAKINWRSLPLAQARETGAMMLFGEKYPDVVRMVSIGDYSRELCGGTHLDNSGQVGLFKVVGEESVSAGTRRITALTGPAALDHVRKHEAALHETAAILRVPPAEVPARVAALAKEVRELKKQMTAAPRPGAVTAEALLADAAQQGDVKVVVAEAPGADANAMRQLIDQLRKAASPVAVLLGSAGDGKVTLVAGVSRDLVDRGASAPAWIKGAAQIVGGSGGGKPDMAQAGGKHPEKLSEALDAARREFAGLLKA
jgi:alanyl-tRNA synthetase